MKLSDVRVDMVKVEEGAWVDNIPDLPGVRFKVRGSNNKDWRKLQSRLIATVPRKKRVGNALDPDELDRVNGILLIECGVIDWDGLETDDGPLPYSKEACAKIVKDPTLVRVREGMNFAVNLVGDGVTAEIEDAVKN